MDFKVAGTDSGVTAIQLDVKIPGLTDAQIKDIFVAAKKARLQILEIMLATLPNPKPALSVYAPKIETVKIPVDKIGALIGPGGKNIRSLQEETNANIEVDDTGKVYISSTNAQAVDAAKTYIQGMTAVPEVGKTYHGRVVKVAQFGAFVQILPGKDGLVHISQLAHGRVERVEDVVKEGDEIDVKLVEIDSQGRINLSRKALLPLPEGMTEEPAYTRPSSPRGDRGGRGDYRGGQRRNRD
jgi:polyribonucleotide nucleotidyltransferase